MSTKLHRFEEEQERVRKRFVKIVEGLRETIQENIEIWKGFKEDINNNPPPSYRGERDPIQDLF